MRAHLVIPGLLAVLGAGAGLAQDSLCDPCVDPPLNRQLGPGEGRQRPDATPVITVEEMRALGVIDVADLVNSGLNGLPAAAGPGAAPVLETARFRVLQRPESGLPLPETLGQDLETLYARVAERMHAEREIGIDLVLMPADPRSCPLRGRALPRARQRSEIHLMAAPDWSREQILGLVAHELGHVLQGLDSDIPVGGTAALHQGLASWAAGDYWAKMQGAETLAAVVQGYLDEGSYRPLDQLDAPIRLDEPAGTGLGPDCIARRDRIITSWAAFIDYLVTSRGRERFIALMSQEISEARPALDFAAAYGETLAALEAAWLTALEADE